MNTKGIYSEYTCIGLCYTAFCGIQNYWMAGSGCSKRQYKLWHFYIPLDNTHCWQSFHHSHIVWVSSNCFHFFNECLFLNLCGTDFFLYLMPEQFLLITCSFLVHALKIWMADRFEEVATEQKIIFPRFISKY